MRLRVRTKSRKSRGTFLVNGAINLTTFAVLPRALADSDCQPMHSLAQWVCSRVVPRWWFVALCPPLLPSLPAGFAAICPGLDRGFARGWIPVGIFIRLGGRIY